MFQQPSTPSNHLAEAMALPKTLAGLVVRTSGWHQLWISLLSVAVFALNAAPLEIQRRIIDAAVKGSALGPILLLTGAFLSVNMAFGLIKLLTNVYRGWVSESAVRALRLVIDRHLIAIDRGHRAGPTDAVSLSMILAECDDIGGFVGTSISVPIVEGGFLVTVFAYLLYLQPWMAAVGFAVLTPQLVFVPLMQRAINRRVSRRITLMRQVGFDVLSTQSGSTGADDHRKFDLVFDVNIGVLKFKSTMNFLMNLTYSAGIGAILGFGGWLVLQGQTEIATVVTFVSALGKIVDPWNDLVDWGRGVAVSSTKYQLVETEIVRMSVAASAAPVPSP